MTEAQIAKNLVEMGTPAHLAAYLAKILASQETRIAALET